VRDVQALRKNPPLAAALAILLIAGATLGGAWIFQAFGYAPCELCLKERIPYYIGVVIAALAIGFVQSGRRSSAQTALIFLCLLFLFSFGFGAYHAGVEWGFWPGPTDCTGSFQKANSTAEFLKLVRCDEVALRILGLSLAGWNAVISLVLAGLAIFGLSGKTS
jgi:disulfide bond formation protein DsbB